ncbi:MAG: MFS transporter [Actinomycetota bacterium]|nr:MFS transporter [Actinomycetota bacterium]
MARVVASLAATVEGYAAVARSENLRRSQLAWAGAVTAEWAFFVGLGVLAFDEGGTLAVGLMWLIRMLPAALIAPFASLLGDRYRRDRFVLGLFLAMAAAAAIAAVAVLASPPIAAIYAVAAVHAIASTLSRSAQWALLPSLSRTPEELIAANGATLTTESAGTLAGPVVGAALLAVTSVGAVFALCAGTYLVAAVALARIRLDEEPQTGRARLPRGAEILAGFRAFGNRNLLLITALFQTQALVRGALNVFLVVVALRLLDTGDAGVGVLTGALGLGGLVGAFASISLSGRRLTQPFAAGLVFWGLPLVAIGVWPEEWLALVMVAVIGAANSLLDVAGFTILQRLIPDDVLTRALGVFWGAAMATIGIGSIASAGLVAGVGVRGALVATGAVLPLLTLLTWRALSKIDRDAVVPAEELTALDRVPMFARLSLVAKEQLASRLVGLDVPPGATIIREGDHGDRFYLVVAGEADVTAGGRTLTLRQPGEFFGEIALLRDVPRTATVTARTPMRLYALERADFLDALTRHAAGREAGEDVVDERLATLAPGP